MHDAGATSSVRASTLAETGLPLTFKATVTSILDSSL
jgi:hypothetical protein